MKFNQITNTQSLVLTLGAALVSATSAQASITWGGEINPADPNLSDLNPDINVLDLTGTELHIGQTTGNSGTLDVTLGSDVISHRAWIGTNVAATGTATIDGAGSTWHANQNFIVGHDGNGTLFLTDGGKASSDFGSVIGNNFGAIGNMNISGADSEFSTTNNLNVGAWGDGTLDLSNGATVSSKQLVLGSGNTGTGTMIVDGVGSQSINTLNLFVGDGGSGSLTISNGGHVIGQSFLSVNAASSINFTLASLTDPTLDITLGTYLNGTLNVDLDPGLVLNVGAEITLIEVSNPAGLNNGTFASHAEGDLLGTFGGVDLRLTYVGGDGNDLVAYAVPEPTSLALLSLGGLALMRRRRA